MGHGVGVCLCVWVDVWLWVRVCMCVCSPSPTYTLHSPSPSSPALRRLSGSPGVSGLPTQLLRGRGGHAGLERVHAALLRRDAGPRGLHGAAPTPRRAPRQTRPQGPHVSTGGRPHSLGLDPASDCVVFRALDRSNKGGRWA